MGMKHFNPTTPSLRNMTVSTFDEITKKTPEKSLLATKKKNAGRNVDFREIWRSKWEGQGGHPWDKAHLQWLFKWPDYTFDFFWVKKSVLCYTFRMDLTEFLY